jgi:hypothetical protein
MENKNRDERKMTIDESRMTIDEGTDKQKVTIDD